MTFQLRILLVAGLLLSSSSRPVAAQYTPQHPGSCANGFSYSAGVCIPRGGGGNAYTPPQPGSCGNGFSYSAGVCVPRSGGATNAYQPQHPGSCANGFSYSAGMCSPRR